MKRLFVAVVLSIVVAAAGCGKSGTKTPEEIASTDSVVTAPDGKLTPAELGRQSLVGANPAPVVDKVVTDGGTLVRRYNAEPDTLNPLTSTDAYASALLSLMTDSLASRNRDTLEFEPELAESWELSDDHLTYTFHLRKDVRWHDGKPFTAADVIYSFEKITDTTVNAPSIRNYYRDLQSVVAPDDYTVVFTWAKPYFLSFESSATMPIVPKHIFDDGQDFNTHPAGRTPVGNGMYRFVEWKTNQELVLQRNEDYYGRKPHIKKIITVFTPDDNAALIQASSGDIDTMGVRIEQWVNELQTDTLRQKFNRYSYDERYYSYIGWNERRPFFSDRRVRLAMTQLTNREAILESIYYGLGKIVTGTFFIHSDSYSPEIKPWPYDPVEGARLLDEAGWTDHDSDGIRDKAIDGKTVKFEFDFMFPSGSKTAEKIGVLLQEELKKAGVIVNLRNLEWAAFLQRLDNADFDAVTLAWSLSIEQDPYQLWHSSQIAEGGSNYVAFKNDELDSLIEQARTEFDPEKRNALYHRFNEIVHEEQPYTFLFCPPATAIVNKRFHNVIVHTLGLDVRDWYVPAAMQKPL